MDINHKNIYHQTKKHMRDLTVRNEIERTFQTHPAYGHRRLALELEMNKKKILRIMHKFHLKPPRLWHQKKFITRSDPVYRTQYCNLLKKIDLTQYDIGEIWSSDLTYINPDYIGINISVSDPGSPWQNSWSESFFSRFKGESGGLNRFETLGELIEYIFGYINYYNNLRIHTKLKMSPYQFKQKVSECVLEKWGT